MTFLDSIDSFKAKYWNRSIKTEPKTKVNDVFMPSRHGSSLRKFSADKLNQELRRKTAHAASLYIKGVEKKSADTFRAWFTLENEKNGAKPSVDDETIIRIFNRNSKIKKKSRIADKCAHIYGDGFMLIEYANDNKAGVGGSTDLSRDITPRAVPIDLRVLDPEQLKEFEVKSEYWKKQGILHFHYQSKEGKELFIHPNRVLHVPRNELPFQKMGTSDIDILIDTLQAYPDVVIATGEILKWFAHGIVTVTKDSMDANQKRDIEKELMEHNNIFVNDSRYKFNVVVPTAIRPKEYYDFIMQNIAGVLVMPTHMLTGVQTTKTSGAEVGFSDYYRDVADDQELLYTPIFEKLYTQLLGSKGKQFKYKLVWNQIYINELAEAELIGKRGAAAQNLKGAGIIDNFEAREIVNKGLIYLDPNKKIKQPTNPTTNVPVQPDKRIVKAPGQKDDDDDDKDDD